MWAAVVVLWTVAIAVIIRELRNAPDLPEPARPEPPLEMVVICTRDGEPTAVVAAATHERAMDMAYRELARQGAEILNIEKRRAW